MGARTRLVAELHAELDGLAARDGLAASTRAAYRRDLTVYGEYLEDLGRLQLDEVTLDDVASFAAALAEGTSRAGRPWAPASRTRILAAVRRVHRELARDGDVDDPTAGLAPRRLADERSTAPEGAVVAPPTPQQLDDLVASIRGDDVGALRDRVLLVLLVEAGVRVGELVKLDVDAVRDDATLLHVAGRELPLGAFARRAVRGWLVEGRPRLHPDGPALVLNRRGGRLTRQGAWRVVRSRAAAAGLGDHLRPRDVRAAFVARLVDEGHDEATVRAWTGDATDHAQRRHRGGGATRQDPRSGPTS